MHIIKYFHDNNVTTCHEKAQKYIKLYNIKVIHLATTTTSSHFIITIIYDDNVSTNNDKI